MKKVVLPNGLTIIFEKKMGNSVVIEVMVNVGSNIEKKNERGISHFLEHILFEGTEKRPNNREISNEIEKIGGDFNAYTSYEKTCFHIKVLKKYFNTAVDVLADIMLNSLFREEDITKEKNIVLKEIDMILDEPKYSQWILLQKNLFEKHPCRYPTYGDEKIIKNLNRKKVTDFFNKHYVASNVVISIVGDVDNWKEEVMNKFTLKKGKTFKHPMVEEPKSKNNKIKKIKKDIINTHIVIGFKTVPRINKDSYVLDVINGILGRGQSGKMFTEIRSKKGLAYDVGTQSLTNKSFGYFAVYATIDKRNIKQVKNIILQELDYLKKISQSELKEAKDYIEGDYLLEIEDSQKVADQLLAWELMGDAKLMKDYVKNVRNVGISDVRRVAQKYFNNYTMIMLEGK
ncbi:MAG: pitrilysin family protein [Nanoarchaeota archaeon]|nr:insulinase family protein [Nanoarchaeota archaeon]MBU1632157.1 insulinase family protein [Nanoarchaeota archaeon]MBU1876358.1 insulinase family protein [Nanoarchaeota archaeon]